ncbi:hypothetical protein ABI_09020 [Asticcacaulis biprosthecium C19]|uniref:Uncharacterized protein n=1 Tax=Asticcacaulis biprosthecium C19 TaxID=715226 RepID=F4QGD8_9CAUL|nr:hypothetical protein [Asticcacaulis biprosthecium]EGF92466.1 hypothetical protein ABI_09020 [Asticcacaulis biprosthecium C19]
MVKTLRQQLEKLPPHLKAGPPSDSKTEEQALYKIDAIKAWATRWADWQERELNALNEAIFDKDWNQVELITQRLKNVGKTHFPDLHLAIDHLAEMRP